MVKKLFSATIMLIMLLLFCSIAWSALTTITTREKTFENKILQTANTLIQQRKPDEAISMLKDYRETVREDFDSKVLLAEAYLEKCSQMKETMDISENEYQHTIAIPFNMGKSIMVNDSYDNDKLSYGSYICAKSYLLNSRIERAQRYSNYAIEKCTSPDIQLYILKADVFAESYCHELKVLLSNHNHYKLAATADKESPYLNAIQTYEQIIRSTTNNLIKSRLYYKMGVFELAIVELNKNKGSLIELSGDHILKAQKNFKACIPNADDRTKAMSYYYLGVIEKEQNNNEAAQKSFSSALNLAKDDSLKNMIQKNMK